MGNKRRPPGWKVAACWPHPPLCGTHNVFLSLLLSPQFAFVPSDVLFIFVFVLLCMISFGWFRVPDPVSTWDLLCLNYYNYILKTTNGTRMLWHWLSNLRIMKVFFFFFFTSFHKNTVEIIQQGLFFIFCIHTYIVVYHADKRREKEGPRLHLTPNSFSFPKRHLASFSYTSECIWPIWWHSWLS